MKKCIYIFLLLFSIFNTASAQQFQIIGRVVNGSNNEHIEYASVGLLRSDSILIAGGSSDDKGCFTLKVRNWGQYILKVSFMGFKTTYQKVKLTKRQNRLDIGNVALSINDNVLKEAIVKATLSKVEQKEDTTVFNAGAYRVPEGSTLEALVKQLPGVEISDDGSITWNGKKITELLINGKDFFKGDNKVAMKNLPSDLVSKIKAYDKKSDYTEQTGIDDGEEKSVLDISTKRKLDRSWISNIDMAYGTKDRYSADLFISRFTDRSRVSAYASLGNIDKYHYGGSGGGLTSNKSGGIDFGWQNDKEKREAGRSELGGSVYYGYSGTDMLSTSSSETFLSSGSTSSFSNHKNKSSYSSAYVGANFRLEWNPDSMTSIRFRPSFSHNQGDNEGRSLSATFNGDPYAVSGIQSPLDSIFVDHPDSDLAKIAVNKNAHQSLGDSKSNSFNGEFSILRRLNSRGRNLSFRARGSYQRSESNSFSISDIFYFNGTDGKFLNQYSHTPSKNWYYNLRLGYAEPITDKLVFESRYAFGFKFNDSDRSRYNLDKLGGKWADAMRYPAIGSLPTEADSLAAVRDLQNSQYATYKYYDHTIDLSIQYKTEDIRLNVGVDLNPEKTKMEYNRPGQHIDTLITRDVFQVMPDARFRYRFTKTNSLEVRYRGNASQPSMTSLLAVVDNSNPLSISMGNPGLRPSWTNSFSVNYDGYNSEHQRGVYSGADYSQTGRSVSNLLVYDESTGVRYMRPENINGNWNTNAYVMFNTGLGKDKKFNVMTYSNFNFNNSVGYVSSFSSGNTSKYLFRDTSVGDLSHYDAIFENADVKKNTTHSLSFNEKLRLGYQHEFFDIGVSSSFIYNHSKSSLQERSNMDTWHFDYGGHVNFNFDWGGALSTDIRMRSRRGYSDASMNSNELLWNAKLSQSFLKKKAATISLQFYDILHEQSNVSRRVDAMQRSDSWTNAINSYCMVHFIYKLNIYPGKKTASSETSEGSTSSEKKKGKKHGGRKDIK